jgi:hypothetical protein
MNPRSKTVCRSTPPPVVGISGQRVNDWSGLRKPENGAISSRAAANTRTGPGQINVRTAHGIRLAQRGATSGSFPSTEDSTIATITAPRPAAREQPKVQTLPHVRAAHVPTAQASGFRPTWEHFCNRGDRIALAFWMICFVLMALMVALDPLLQLFR